MESSLSQASTDSPVIPDEIKNKKVSGLGVEFTVLNSPGYVDHLSPTRTRNKKRHLNKLNSLATNASTRGPSSAYSPEAIDYHQ